MESALPQFAFDEILEMPHRRQIAPFTPRIGTPLNLPTIGSLVKNKSTRRRHAPIPKPMRDALFGRLAQCEKPPMIREAVKKDHLSMILSHCYFAPVMRRMSASRASTFPSRPSFVYTTHSTQHFTFGSVPEGRTQTVEPSARKYFMTSDGGRPSIFSSLPSSRVRIPFR